MTTGLYDEDSSMQGYGKRLGLFSGAVDETHTAARKQSDTAATLAEAYRNAARQVESDLPGAKRLAAEMESQAKKAERARALAEESADILRSLGAEASGLPGVYRAEHETDEDRLHSPRNGIAAERRADVRAAEQDT